MTLSVLNQIEDKRGRSIFLKFNKKRINLVEIKKGFARGGHYHDFDVVHTIISGTIEYVEKDIDSGDQKKSILAAPFTVKVPKRVAHMFIAREDAVFLEVFEHEFSATNDLDLRKIVEEKMKQNNDG